MLGDHIKGDTPIRTVTGTKGGTLQMLGEVSDPKTPSEFSTRCSTFGGNIDFEVLAGATVWDGNTHVSSGTISVQIKVVTSLKVATEFMWWLKKPAGRSWPPEGPRNRVEVLLGRLAGEQVQGRPRDLGEKHLSEVVSEAISEIPGEIVTQTISTMIWDIKVEG